MRKDFCQILLIGLRKDIKLYDAVSEFTKEIGVENFEKLFKDFSGALTLAINGIIIAGAVALRGGLFKKPPRFGGGVSIRTYN